MNESRYGRERLCPNCGTRVAQRATNCFFCGASLDGAPSRGPSIPWPDIALLLVIGGLLVLWWFRAPESPAEHMQIVGGAALVSPTSVDESSPQPLLVEAGPESTPTPTPLPSDTPAPQATPQRYVVVAGDTLELIAGQFEVSLRNLMEVNGLSATDLLHIGDELIIPVGGVSAAPTPIATPTGGTLVYTVRPGDTIQSIAARYNSRVEWILAANNMQATDLLQINQSLLVPQTAVVVEPSPTPTRIPRPLGTPVLPIRKPALLSPAEGESISGEDAVLLNWASVAVLGEDEWYVVTLRIEGAPEQIAPHWTKGTSWRLTSDLRLAGREATVFTWQVQVMSGSPQNPGEGLSEPSDPRNFTWR